MSNRPKVQEVGYAVSFFVVRTGMKPTPRERREMITFVVFFIDYRVCIQTFA